MTALLAEKLRELIFVIPCVLVSLTFHEFAHGWVAMKLGDPTARNLGRLTLNPLKHLDPIGTICMIFFHFGWARPVPINSRYFKKPKRDMALTAAAGPIMNFLLAFVSAFITQGLIFVFTKYPVSSSVFLFGVRQSAVTLFSTFHILNLSLGLFNLIPLPPLDGSRLLFIFLPSKWYFGIMKYERYIMLGFLVLLWSGIITLPLSVLVKTISNGMFSLANLVFPL